MLLTIQAVAQELGVSKRHVHRLLDSGDLAGVRVGARAVRVSPDALAAFIATRTEGPREKITVAAGTSKFATGGSAFIASALSKRARHRRATGTPAKTPKGKG